MNRNWYRTFFLFLLSGIPFMSAAQDYREGNIYKWVDLAGRVHYADTPQRNAELVFIPNQRNEKPELSTVKIAPFVENERKIEQQKIKENILTLEQPKDQETLENTGGQLTIVVSSSIPLEQGHRWQVIIDGQNRGEPQSSNRFVLQNIDRGEHTLQIHAVDTHGKVWASSTVVTFYMFQARA